MTPERLSRLSKSRVAVIGDVMIDEYLIGRVERISPEAPVPVVRGVETRAAPGGAANVAANIAALGGRADLVGVVGLGGAPELAALLEPKGLVVCRLVEDANRRTIRKTRVMANRQQIVRLDREDTDPLAAEAEAGLIAAAGAAIAENDIVVVSDYGKGSISDTVLKAIIGMAKSAGRKVLVDPKRPEFTAYRGADLLTPNRSELARASGLPVDSDAQVEAAARVAQAQFGGDLLITRSEQGLAYIPLLGAPIYASTMAREVFDVSGAGDTVAATLAMALAAQFPMVEALQLANYAAGIVVGKAGTATVSLAELIAAMRTPNARSDGALAALAEARRLRESWERQGLTVGLTNGCFDLLHPGHVTLIAQAAAACDRLIVSGTTGLFRTSDAWNGGRR